MPANSTLKEYHAKRDFSRTPEPQASEPGKVAEEQQNRVFVVQKHNATRLHYDFRLEIDGVLKSWAVPKGPSLNPAEKRLAVETEDHPLEYASFEGIIPKGEYGAGSVIVWDGGIYRNLKASTSHHPPVSMAEAYEHGHLAVWLEGKKLRGGFALIRTKRLNNKPSWLLIKMDDAEARPDSDIEKEQPGSILSEQVIEALKV